MEDVEEEDLVGDAIEHDDIDEMSVRHEDVDNGFIDPDYLDDEWDYVKCCKRFPMSRRRQHNYKYVRRTCSLLLSSLPRTRITQPSE